MKNNKSPREYAFHVMDILCLPEHSGFTNDFFFLKVMIFS